MLVLCLYHIKGWLYVICVHGGPQPRDQLHMKDANMEKVFLLHMWWHYESTIIKSCKPLRGGACIAYCANSFIKVAPATPGRIDSQSQPQCVLRSKIGNLEWKSRSSKVYWNSGIVKWVLTTKRDGELWRETKEWWYNGLWKRQVYWGSCGKKQVKTAGNTCELMGALCNWSFPG